MKDKELEVEVLQEVREYFDSDNVGSGSELKKQYRNKRNDVRNQMDSMEDNDENFGESVDYLALDIEWNELNDKIAELVEERKQMTADVAKAKAAATKHVTN